MDTNPEKVEIRLSEVINMLDEGNTREQIGQHFGLNKAETKVLFQHEKLKGKRPKKMPSFTITDDLNTGDTPDTPAQEMSLDENPSTEGPESNVQEQSEESIVEQETY